jgi:hypothetical protein
LFGINHLPGFFFLRVMLLVVTSLVFVLSTTS